MTTDWTTLVWIFLLFLLRSSPMEIGRTEVIRDNLNPDWAAQITFTYFFEVQQTLLIRIYDEDKKGSLDLRHHDFLGECSLSVGNLMCSPGQQKTLPLTTSK